METKIKDEILIRYFSFVSVQKCPQELVSLKGSNILIFFIALNSVNVLRTSVSDAVTTCLSPSALLWTLQHMPHDARTSSLKLVIYLFSSYFSDCGSINLIVKNLCDWIKDLKFDYVMRIITSRRDMLKSRVTQVRERVRKNERYIHEYTALWCCMWVIDLIHEQKLHNCTFILLYTI